MTAIQLSTMRDRVKRIGGWVYSTVITSALVDEQINDAVGEYCDMLDATWEGYRDVTGANISTVANTATVALPTDFLKARAVDIRIDGRWYPLTRLTVKLTYGYDDSTGQPTGYRIQGSLVELFPTPDAVYAIRLRYVPAADVLVDDTDSIDIPNGWEKWIIYTVLAVLFDREERDASAARAVVEQIRQRVSSAAAERNTAEPEYIPMPGEGNWGDFR